MADSWKDIEWDARRPSLQEAIDAARRLRFLHRPRIGDACEALLARFRETYVNGGALLATFEVEDDPTTRWFASRNRFDELGFFDAFLGSTTLRDAVPQLFEGDSAGLKQPKFDQVFAGPYLVDGWLAGTLMSGGAYEHFRGTAQEARDLAAAATAEVIQGRYEDFVVYRAWEPWSPWFFDVAWDITGVAIDMANKMVTLFATTDTD